MIDKIVQQDDESARKGRRDVADDDDGKDQNQSPEVAYQRHKLPAGVHLSFHRGHLAGDLSQIGEIDHQTVQNYQRDHGQDEKADVLAAQRHGQQDDREGRQEHLRDVPVEAGNEGLRLCIQIVLTGLIHHVGADGHDLRRGQEAHDGRRDDGVQPPVAQEVVEGVPGVFQTALFLHHQLQEDDDVKAQQKVDGLPCDGLPAQEQQSLCDRDLEQKDGAEDARRHGKVERILQPDDHHNDAENQTKLRNFHCFSSSRSLL